MTHLPNRNRFRYLTAVLVTIAVGLASRRYPHFLPSFLGKYPGDALWALMVFFGWGAVFATASTFRIALLALGTSLTIELLKLVQAPWLINLRHTTLGHLVFGHAFSWQNLVAYSFGVAIGVGIEWLQHSGRRIRSRRDLNCRGIGVQKERSL